MIHHRLVIVLYIYGPMTGDSVSEVIARWRPTTCSAEVAAFARRVVSSAGPLTGARAKALLFAAAKLAGFAIGVGLELDEQVLFRAGVIERFSASSQAGSPPTRRTLRSNLRFLGKAVLAHQPPASPPLSRERAKARYSPAELAGYLALCDAQPTKLRRQRSSALICLGAGAGLIGAELRAVRGVDVVSRSGGVLVEVKGRRPRAVPLLADYHERLLEAAAFFGTSSLVSRRNPNSHNVTNPLIASLSGGSDLPRLEATRLRSTYLAQMAETIGLKAFMEAAGIACTQRLGDLVTHLEPPAEEVAVALLGARR